MKKYDNSFKEEAVKLVHESGKSISQIARDLGMSNSVLSKWVRELKKPSEAEEIATKQEVQRLKKEIQTLKMEREILKKAAAFFAKESR